MSKPGQQESNRTKFGDWGKPGKRTLPNVSSTMLRDGDHLNGPVLAEVIYLENGLQVIVPYTAQHDAQVEALVSWVRKKLTSY